MLLCPNSHLSVDFSNCVVKLVKKHYLDEKMIIKRSNVLYCLSFHLLSIKIYTHKLGALKWFVSCFLNTVPLFAVLGGSTKQSFKF